MINKWLYGDSWEKYPIENDQIWIEKNSNSKLMINDILKKIPEYLKEADMIYTDTPWDTGSMNSFFTKAHIKEKHSFDELCDTVYNCIVTINPKICYLEIGKQNINKYKDILNKLYPVVQEWNIVYKKNPMKLLRGGHNIQQYDFTGLDDNDAPLIAMKNEEFNCVCDFCMGQGLTAVAAYNLQKKFVGSELNKRRLAVTIDKIVKLGGKFNYA